MARLTNGEYRQVLALTRKRMLEYPQTHDQKMWLMHGGDHVFRQREHIDQHGITAAAWAECGTTACFAGHISAAAEELGYAFIDEQGGVSGPALDIVYEDLNTTGRVTPRSLTRRREEIDLFAADVPNDVIIGWLGRQLDGRGPLMYVELTTGQRLDLYSRVYERLTDYEDTHNQLQWLMRRRDDGDGYVWLTATTESFEHIGVDPDEWEQCGTTACYAGHVVATAIEQKLIVVGPDRHRDIAPLAREILGEDHEEWLFGESTDPDDILEHLEELIGALEQDRAASCS